MIRPNFFVRRWIDMTTRIPICWKHFEHNYWSPAHDKFLCHSCKVEEYEKQEEENRKKTEKFKVMELRLKAWRDG